jgi:cytoskeletal protein RodZ
MSDLLEGASHFDGAVFARLREGVGASLEDIVQITKIKKGYLVALEQNNYAALPGAAYVRGFVGQYAQALGLNTPDVVESYMARYKRR